MAMSSCFLRAQRAETPVELGMDELGHVRQFVVDRRHHEGRGDLGRHAELHGEHCDVIGLVGAFGERFHVAAHEVDELARVQIVRIAHDVLEPFERVDLIVHVHRLGHAVGVKQQLVADGHVALMRNVGQPVEKAERQPRLIAHDVPCAVTPQKRRVVSCVHVREVSRAVIVDAGERGHEHARVVALADLAVGVLEGLAQLHAGLHVVSDLAFRRHHEERGGYAFAAYVGDDEPQLAACLVRVVADEEEVVEVAAPPRAQAG